MSGQPDPDRAVVVLSQMGAGKTTLAAALARRWGRPLRDSDADLLAGTGRTAAELAAELGADGLHDLEAEHLHKALATRPARPATPAAVIATPAAVIAAATSVDNPNAVTTGRTRVDTPPPAQS